MEWRARRSGAAGGRGVTHIEPSGLATTFTGDSHRNGSADNGIHPCSLGLPSVA
jgi:hypothetical protein